jgi:hypothetical protein
LLGLDDRAWLAFVVYTQHFAPDLEFATLRAHGQRLEELDLALAVQDALGVKFRYTFDRRGIAARIEVDNILVGVFER